jgi:subtilase family serine protease
MVFETKGKYLALVNVGVIDTVYIQNRKFIPVGKVFYEVPVNMEIPLLIKHTCRVIPPGKPTAYGGTSENNFIRIYKVKQVIKFFPNKEKEIKEFIKLNGTDFDNQKDLIDLIIFCNK